MYVVSSANVAMNLASWFDRVVNGTSSKFWLESIIAVYIMCMQVFKACHIYNVLLDERETGGDTRKEEDS